MVQFQSQASPAHSPPCPFPAWPPTAYYQPNQQGLRQPHSLSFQEVLDRRRWKRQLLIRRVAALWMYTEFFMMTGILASSSAFRMHSSKNPAGRPRGSATNPSLPGVSKRA